MKKFSKKLIGYRLILDIFISLMFGFVTFASFMPEEETIDSETLIKALIVALGVTIILYIILAIYQVFYYKCSGYELRENEIVCVKGVLFKKKSIVEYKRIHAINSKQNIIEKLFGISTLQVDSGSTNTAHTAEIQIIEDESTVQDLIKIIKAKQNNKNTLVSQVDILNSDNINDIYNFDSKKKAIYTALNVAWVIVGGIGALILGIISMSILVLLKEMEWPLLLIVVAGSLLVLIVLTLIIFVFGLFGSIIAYYNFKIIRNENDIEINYGLITKLHNTFKYNKIKAIRISQSIIQKIFDYVTIKVEVVGYTVQSGDENKTYTTGMLIPICKKSEINSLLGSLLPDYIPIEREHEAKHYFPFISFHLLFSFIIFVLIQIISGIFLNYYGYDNEFMNVIGVLWIVYIIYIAILLLERKFAKINSGFSLKDGKLCIYRGSFIQETIVMRKQNIIGIDVKTTYFRKKKNIYSYKIHFRSNAETNTVTVLNIDKTEGDKIYHMIRF